MWCRKYFPVIGVLTAAGFILFGCASKDFSLGDIPTSDVYKFLIPPEPPKNAREMAKVTNGADSGDMVVGTSLDQSFTPSLLKALDYDLRFVLAEDVDKHAITIDMFTIRWINPGLVGGQVDYMHGAVGAALTSALQQLTLAHAIVPDRTHDSLLCYFKGKYHNQKIVIKKSGICPDDARHCFGSPVSFIPPPDTTLPYTKDTAQNLAKECIAEIKNSIATIKNSEKQNASI